MNATNLKNIKILLIGVDGQIGSALFQSLSSKCSIVATSRRQLTTDVEQTVHLDLTQPDEVRRVIDLACPDIIVNAAAYTAVDQAESEFELAASINGRALGIIGREAHRHKIPVVHYSTEYVFNDDSNRRLGESFPTDPINAYGKSKLLGELELQNSNAMHLIFRTSWVYHWDGKNFLKTMLQLAQQRDRIQVVNDQFGCPNPAHLMAEYSLRAFLSSAPDVTAVFKEQGGIYHLSCEGEASWFEFATEIFQQARKRNVPLKMKILDSIPSEAYWVPTPRPKNSRMDTTKFKRNFHIAPVHWSDGLEQVMDVVCLNLTGQQMGSS